MSRCDEADVVVSLLLSSGTCHGPLAPVSFLEEGHEREGRWWQCSKLFLPKHKTEGTRRWWLGEKLTKAEMMRSRFSIKGLEKISIGVFFFLCFSRPTCIGTVSRPDAMSRSSWELFPLRNSTSQPSHLSTTFFSLVHTWKHVGLVIGLNDNFGPSSNENGSPFGPLNSTDFPSSEAEVNITA